jgi:hypothetical protein
MPVRTWIEFWSDFCRQSRTWSCQHQIMFPLHSLTQFWGLVAHQLLCCPNWVRKRCVGLILGHRPSSHREFLLAPIHPCPPLVAFSGPSSCSYCFLWVKPESKPSLSFSPHVIFSPTCWVSIISLLKLASIVALGQTKCWSQIKSTSRSQKTKTRPASAMVVPMEVSSMLKFPRRSTLFLFDPQVIL